MFYINLYNSDIKGIIDEDDSIKILSSCYVWRIQENGYIVSSKSKVCKAHIYLHKLILGVEDRIDIWIDHINRVKIDCRKSNLRHCTQAQNAVNRLKFGSCSSKYKGVSWHKASQKWQSYVVVNNKQVGGGLYENENDAALRSNELYLEYFGTFAILNKID